MKARAPGTLRIGAGCLSLAGVFATPTALACATAPRGEATIEVASESAVIVWDEAKQREHFIRGATFAGSAKEAAFLVPTPSVPELATVPNEPFTAIAKRAEPAHERVTKWGVDVLPLCLLFTLTRSASKASVDVGVEVVSNQRVGDYDATVLRGTSAEAITKWLDENKYPARPALVRWLAPYVERGFYFTAFRLAETPRGGGLAATTVRISFDTPRPFYPYREPDDASPHYGRLLRLAFIGTGKPAVKVGEKPWIDPVFSNELGPTVPLPFAPPERAWLTVYEDRVDTRRGLGDLVFTPTNDRRIVTPPPIIEEDRRDIPLPLDVLLGLGLVGGLALWVSRRRPPGEDAITLTASRADVWSRRSTSWTCLSRTSGERACVEPLVRAHRAVADQRAMLQTFDAESYELRARTETVTSAARTSAG